MAKTAEFQTLLRNYRGVMGNMRINNIWISFDSSVYNYYEDDDTIQFNLAGQEGVISVSEIVSYEKLSDEDLYEGSDAGYRVVLASGDVITFYCFNPRNRG